MNARHCGVDGARTHNLLFSDRLMDFRIPRGLPLSRSEGGATKGGGGERGAAKLSARSLCPVAKFGRKARSLQADARGGQRLTTCRLDEHILHVLDSLLLPLRDDRG